MKSDTIVCFNVCWIVLSLFSLQNDIKFFLKIFIQSRWELHRKFKCYRIVIHLINQFAKIRLFSAGKYLNFKWKMPLNESLNWILIFVCFFLLPKQSNSTNSSTLVAEPVDCRLSFGEDFYVLIFVFYTRIILDFIKFESIIWRAKQL